MWTVQQPRWPPAVKGGVQNGGPKGGSKSWNPSLGGSTWAPGGAAAWAPGGGSPSPSPQWQQWSPSPSAAPQQWQTPLQSPPCQWITLTEESKLTEQGFPPEGPAMYHDKAFEVFSSAHNVLSEFVGDVTAEVEIHHDADWQMFPEVARAVQAAGGEENCIAIATCPNASKWACGLACGWKGRETACKLALAMAIAAESDQTPKICQNNPEFARLCVDVGILQPTAWGRKTSFNKGSKGGKGAGGGGGGGEGASNWLMKPQGAIATVPQQQAAPQELDFTAFGLEAPQQAMAVAGQLAPGPGECPPVVWITLTRPESQILADGFPPEAPAVSYDKSQPVFKIAQHLLQELVDITHVNFNHDPEWTILPEVAAAIKAAGGEENCYCVATCVEKARWAVGLGAGWKPREASAKIALAVALGTDVEGGLDTIGASHPEFAAYCGYAGLTEQSAAKRLRLM